MRNAFRRALIVHFRTAAALGALVLACAFTPMLRAQALGAPTLTIDGLGKGSAPLDGLWQFHLGGDPAFASAGINDATGQNGWEQITADAPWGAQGHRSYVGYAWYRRHLHLTPAPGAPPDFSLLINHIEDVYEIYWNGALVARHGKMPPHPFWRYSEPPQTFNLGPIRDGVLAVRVWKSPLASYETGIQGGFTAAPLAGSSAAVADRATSIEYTRLHTSQYYFAAVSLYAIVMALSLLVWVRDRSQHVLLWMACFCASPVALCCLTRLLPWSFNTTLAWIQPSLSLLDIGLWFLLLYLLKLDGNPRLKRATIILAIINLSATSLDGVLSVLDWSSPLVAPWWQTADAVLTTIFTLSQMYAIVLVAFAIGKRLDLARWLVAGFAFIFEMFNVIRTTLSQGSRFTHWTIADKINEPLFTINGNRFNVVILAATGLLLAIIYAVYRYSRETLERQQAIEQELRSAQELQQVLIPEKLPALAGYAVTSAYRPAQEVGGDFFQIIPLEDGATLIVLGDVSGKGLKAAMTVSLIVGTVRTLAETAIGPAEILAGLNRRLHGRLEHGFVTCLAMRLETYGDCTIANAGHPSPFLNEREVALPSALPLGLDAAASYEEMLVHLGIGDRLTLYTDGLPEARNAARELFGFGRLEELMATQPDAQRATEAAVQFGQEDDITVLTLMRLAVGEESTTQLSAPELASA
jgi:hypothetical protein